jgi:aromatic ring hydroxylase
VPARTGQDYLNGLKATSREIWLGGEMVESVTEHPLLKAGAEAIASYYEAGRAADPDPETGEDMNISHMQPRSKEDLEPG